MYARLYNSFMQQQKYSKRKQVSRLFQYFETSLFAGFTGQVPFGYASFGKTNQAMTNSALCDFTSNYRKRLSTEWAPVSIARPDPPLLIQPSEIYHKHIGQLPNYAGHIPGAIFRWFSLLAFMIILFHKSTQNSKRLCLLIKMNY